MRQGAQQSEKKLREAAVLLRWFSFVMVGLIAGYCANALILSRGIGLARCLIGGVIGAFLGGYFFDLIGQSQVHLFGKIAGAIFGSMVVIFGIWLVRRR